MRSSGDIVHSDLLVSLEHLFDSTLTVKEKGNNRNTHGEEVGTWSNLEDHVNLHCAVGHSIGTGQKGNEADWEEGLRRVLLKGLYASITTKHRVVLNNVVYSITDFEHDQALTATALVLRRVK